MVGVAREWRGERRAGGADLAKAHAHSIFQTGHWMCSSGGFAKLLAPLLRLARRRTVQRQRVLVARDVRLRRQSLSSMYESHDCAAGRFKNGGMVV